MAEGRVDESSRYTSVNTAAGRRVDVGSADGRRPVAEERSPTMTAQQTDFEARAAEIREAYLKPGAATPVDRARRPPHGADLQRRRAHDPVLPGCARLPADRADGEPRLQRARRTCSSTSGTTTCWRSSISRAWASSRASRRSAASSTSRSRSTRSSSSRSRRASSSTASRTSGPTGADDSLYFKDPDGIQIELIREPLLVMEGRPLG